MNIILTEINEDDLKIIYDAKKCDKELINYTCRPLEPFPDFNEYYSNIHKKINSHSVIYRIIKIRETNEPIGTINAFDINNRNRSAEFRYYIIHSFRNRKFGKKAISLFIDEVFTKNHFNKLYATTSSNNSPSVKILKSLNFSLDGRNREHYWIKNKRYDQLIYSML